MTKKYIEFLFKINFKLNFILMISQIKIYPSDTPKINLSYAKIDIYSLDDSKKLQTISLLSLQQSIPMDFFIPIVQYGLSSKVSQIVKLSYDCLYKTEIDSEAFLMLTNTLIKNINTC